MDTTHTGASTMDTTTATAIMLPGGGTLTVPAAVADDVAAQLQQLDVGQDRPLTVHQAIAKVMAEMDAVGKNDTAPASAGGYRYRGIEAVTAALRKLCAKHGVVIWPVTRVIEAPPSIAMKEGWLDWRVEVTYAVAGPDGTKLDPPPVTYGIGRDNTDKGINKAMTQAFKYLLLQLFMVADDAHDGDGADYSGGRAPEDQGARMLGEATAKALAGKVKALSSDQREHLAAAWVQVDPMTGDPYLPVDKDGKPALRMALAEHEHAILQLIAEAKAARPAATDTPASQDVPGSAPQAPQDAPAAPAAGTDTPEPAQGDTAPTARQVSVNPAHPGGQDAPAGPPYADGEEPF